MGKKTKKPAAVEPVKRKGPERKYPLEEWLAKGTFVIVKGKDWHGRLDVLLNYLRAMTSMRYRKGLHIVVSPDERTVTVTVHKVGFRTAEANKKYREKAKRKALGTNGKTVSKPKKRGRPAKTYNQAELFNDVRGARPRKKRGPRCDLP